LLLPQVRANVAAGEPKAAARKPTTVNLGDEVEDAKQGRVKGVELRVRQRAPAAPERVVVA
jgi:hypothetical protein